MYVNEKDSNNSAVIGQRGEDLFVKLIKSQTTLDVIKANYTQQVKEHWDFCLSGGTYPITVDVKAMKRTNRWTGEPQDEVVWVEFRNISGNDGWIYKNADCFAFECKDGFIVVGRKDLAKKCEKLVGFKKDEITLDKAKSKIEMYKLYTRKDRKDILTTITKQDLLDMKHTRLRYT